MFTEDIAHEEHEDRLAELDAMDLAMNDDPALEWDEDPRAAMYDQIADEFEAGEAVMYEDEHLEAQYEDQWGYEDYEPNPYDGTYSEE